MASVATAESQGEGVKGASGGAARADEHAALLAGLRASVIGDDVTFATPYGRRKVVYVDYTASGRALQGVEDYVAKTIL